MLINYVVRMLQCTKTPLKIQQFNKIHVLKGGLLIDQLYIKRGNKVRIDVGGFVAISANNFNDVSSRRTPDSNSD